VTYPSRTAEAVVFRERFRNAATVHTNGGALVGSPLIKDGVYLTGSEYITHPISTMLDGRRFLTIVFEFWPDTDYDEDALANLFSTTSDDYRAYKDNNTASNVLGIVLGGTSIATIASATYSGSWRVGERNVLVISSDGTTTDAWLNKTQILTADATAWTPTNPATLYTGALADGSGKLEGRATELSIQSLVMVQADVDALQDGSLFRYSNSSELWADMESAIVDGSNDRTPDRSRHGRTVLLGDGAGTGTPTFSNPGFVFDGGNDYMTLPADPTGTYTVVTKRIEDIDPVFESDLTTWTKIKTAGQFSGTLGFLAWFPFALSPIQQTDLNYLLRGIR
jgi:hypothetical protein